MTYTNETVLYYYKTYSELHRYWPNYGPTHGGTMISVWGKDFDDFTWCYLDRIKIKPVRVNDTLIVCEAPMHKAAVNLSFELAFADLNYITKTGFKFTYYNDLQINTVEP